MSLDIDLCNSGQTVFEINVTHNLNRMADAAGIYKVMWRPEEIGNPKAGEIILTLRLGLSRLIENREYYQQFTARNGWGTYESFVPQLRAYLAACIENPRATISVSR